jgi:major vault protein
MANQNRERDLVLAPNEYAYISDQTKGHIVAYVGPFKTSMANTDQPVFFNSDRKKFVDCILEEAIQTFTTVPEGWYAALKNPSIDGVQPIQGTSNNLPKLNVGRKVNIPGPDFFALWPGQMVKVIKGHRLRSNQYLIVRVYEEEQAKKNWAKAVIMPQKQEIDKDKKDTSITDSKTPNLAVGKLLVIKGTDVSFYIPPTGLEVVADNRGEYVRDAVTLEILEYCILLDEDGNKRYIQGPDVVTPKPTEKFYEKNSFIKFKAIELSENSGIHVKVISPYKEGNKTYNIGDEIFITGKELKIYHPRIEQAIIKYGEQEIYHAVAIPPGEGRYYLNRNNGQISLMRGPSMFLPDPREAVIVQRILSEKQANLWYPGNKEVLEFNARLRDVARYEKLNEYLTQKEVQKYFSPEIEKTESKVSNEIASDEFIRKRSVTQAKSITLDTKFQGAVTIDVWTGYAMMVTSKTGNRKVIVGPQTYLLEYDEDLAVIELSTGKPKTDEKLAKTVFLRVLHNKVSDIVEAETKDLCPVKVSLSYRVNFTGEPEKWFNVENYVKFLCEHMRSRIRNTIKKLSIIEFYANGIDILRDAVLGKTEPKTTRIGGKFEENGMHIYDLEIFEIDILDPDIENLLFDAQHQEMKRNLQIVSKQNEFKFTKEHEELVRNISAEKSVTKQNEINLQIAEIEKDLMLSLSKLDTEIKSQQKQLDAKLQKQKTINDITENKLAREKANEELQLELSQKALEQRIAELQADVNATVNKAKAVSPDLVAALQSFSDRALAEKMAQSMAPLSIIGGKSIAEVFSNLLKGTVLESVLKPAEHKPVEQKTIPEQKIIPDKRTKDKKEE